jgi:hypothetical protein
MMINTSLEFS